MTDSAFSERLASTYRILDSTKGFVVHPVFNAIELACTSATINGGGATTFPNLIGFATSPASTTITNYGQWTDDVTYVSGGAVGATISGGYDHINNQPYGTICGGGHNFLRYDAAGCSVVVGGSFNFINAAYSVIGAGRQSSVNSIGDYAAIGGGQNSLINAPHSVLFGGNSHRISTGSFHVLFGGFGLDNTVTPNHFVVCGGFNHAIADSDYACILGGNTQSVAGVADGCTILGGDINAASANWTTVLGGFSNSAGGARYQAILGGRNNDGSTAAPIYAAYLGRDNVNTTGIYSLAAGNGNTALGRGTITFGKQCRHPATNGFSLSSGQLNQSWDNQSSYTTEAKATTTTSLVSMNLLTLSAGQAFTQTVRVRVVGMRDGSADGNNDGNYAMAVYEEDIGVHWDGTNLYLFTATAEDGPATSAELALTKRGGGGVLDLSPASIVLTGFDGILRTLVAGILNTTIHWISSYRILGTVIN